MAQGKVRTTKGRGRLFDSILDTVGDTPVVKIGTLGPKNVTLYVKFEAFNPMGSVKDRLALAVIEDAERSGALKPGTKPLSKQRAETPELALPWCARARAIRLSS